MNLGMNLNTGKHKPVPPQWQELITEFKEILRAKGHTSETIKTRNRQLSYLARNFPDILPTKIGKQELLNWAAKQNWTPETRKSFYVGLRQFYKLLDLHPNPAASLPTVKIPRAWPRPIPEYLLAESLTEATPRTRLILEIAAGAGLRGMEIAVIHQNDITLEYGNKSNLRVHGKGGNKRNVPLQDWLASKIWRACSDSPTSYCFPGNQNGHLSPQHVGKLARRALPKGWPLHTLRHRYATISYRATKGDLLTVQRLLGHASVETTQRYAEPETRQIQTILSATDPRNL